MNRLLSDRWYLVINQRSQNSHEILQTFPNTTQKWFTSSKNSNGSNVVINHVISRSILISFRDNEIRLACLVNFGDLQQKEVWGNEEGIRVVGTVRLRDRPDYLQFK
ncbi:hypothetical protein WN51_06832 [Melipona quadrifasciata]|uniref:Uncharacterized protein n=1 Tax=Melipona quadrifasciata TaxID=166423 RepID=A0A0N0BCG4_9HYME|nr:hypothetical protein WN51_06832 [Melipona quadrifasciata]